MCNSLAISEFFFPVLNIYPQIPPVYVLLLLLEMIINFNILINFITLYYANYWGNEWLQIYPNVNVKKLLVKSCCLVTNN